MNEMYQANNISNIWDSVSIHYEFDNYWKLPENHANMKYLLDFAGNVEGKKIIEMGCGSGFTSIALSQRGADVTLLDISSVALEKAVEQFHVMNVTTPQIYLGDALQSEIPSNIYDIAWNGGVIEHFYDEGKKKLILEMYRIVKPGGKVIILVPNSWCWLFQIIQTVQKWRKTWPYGFEDDMSPLRLERMCNEIGFKSVTAFSFNPILAWRWIPKMSKILELIGLETIERHSQRSITGFISVLVINKGE